MDPTRPPREIRIFGMMMLFTLIVCFLVEGWRYAEPAILTAIITGGFAGEAWHRWRTGS